MPGRGPSARAVANGSTVGRSAVRNGREYGGETWRDQSECRDADPEVFYPRPMQEGGAEDVKLGKALCAGCPVQDECLEEAVELGDVWGWRAGQSPNQIKAMVVDRHGSAPLEGFGDDWHERNSTILDGKTPREIREVESARTRARNWYRDRHDLDENGRRREQEEPAWELPEQRQPDEVAAEVA